MIVMVVGNLLIMSHGSNVRAVTNVAFVSRSFFASSPPFFFQCRGDGDGLRLRRKSREINEGPQKKVGLFHVRNFLKFSKIRGTSVNFGRFVTALTCCDSALLSQRSGNKVPRGPLECYWRHTEIRETRDRHFVMSINERMQARCYFCIAQVISSDEESKTAAGER